MIIFPLYEDVVDHCHVLPPVSDGVRKVVGYFDPNRADPIDWVSPIQWEGGYSTIYHSLLIPKGQNIAIKLAAKTLLKL